MRSPHFAFDMWRMKASFSNTTWESALISPCLTFMVPLRGWIIGPLEIAVNSKLFDDLVDEAEGLLSARIFVDPEIYRAELDRVFAPSWLFVAHESELPRPGSFVTRWMGEDPVIAWRGADNKVRVMLNVCRHRGRRVCGEDQGQAANFRCPCHGWTYGSNGDLVGVPFLAAYQGHLDTE